MKKLLRFQKKMFSPILVFVSPCVVVNVKVHPNNYLEGEEVNKIKSDARLLIPYIPWRQGGDGSSSSKFNTDYALERELIKECDIF